MWSNSRANVASGAATEVLVMLMHKVSEYVLRDPYTTRTSNVNAKMIAEKRGRRPKSTFLRSSDLARPGKSSCEFFVILMHKVSEDVLRDGRGKIPLAARSETSESVSNRNLSKPSTRPSNGSPKGSKIVRVTLRRVLNNSIYRVMASVHMHNLK